MSRQTLSARVVIIGGGIGGCSPAYHLAELEKHLAAIKRVLDRQEPEYAS
jgi:glycine/D-amino acid oxidase-like deaminating enzyme